MDDLKKVQDLIASLQAIEKEMAGHWDHKLWSMFTYHRTTLMEQLLDVGGIVANCSAVSDCAIDENDRCSRNQHEEECAKLQFTVPSHV